MSRDAIASVYTIMLTNDEFREIVAETPDVLDKWELDDGEKELLVEDARAEVAGFSTSTSGVLSYISGPTPLSQPVGSALGIALNTAAGLPTRSLVDSGFASCGSCCPWNKSFVR